MAHHHVTLRNYKKEFRIVVGVCGLNGHVLTASMATRLLNENVRFVVNPLKHTMNV